MQKDKSGIARRFLTGGGAMGELIRSKDWSASEMGEPEKWSPSLKAAVATCLNSPVPMSVFWGDQLRMICNDAFNQLMEKAEPHPFARSSDEINSEAWTVLHPWIKSALKDGNAKSTPNARALLKWNGLGEHYHFTLSFNALYNENGDAEGVIGIVNEATSREGKESNTLEEKVRESEERYRALFNSIDAGFCTIEVLFDKSGKPFNYAFLETNEAFEQQTGLKNVTGKTVNDFVQMEEFWYEVYGSVATTGKPVRFENRAENLHRFYDVYAFKIGSSDDRKVGVLFTDITPRKIAEEGQAFANKALEDSESRFRNILQEAPVAATLFRGADLVIEIANELTLKYWGKDKSIIGKPLIEAAPELIDQGLVAQLKEVYAKGGVAHFQEVPIRFAERGVWKEDYYTYSIKALYDANGKVESLLSIGVDVTERVRARQRIEESEAQLTFAIDAAELGVWDYDPITNKFRANARLKEWFGLQPEEDIELTTAVDVMDEVDRQRVSEAIQKALTWGGGNYDIEYSILNPKTSQKRIVRAKGKASFGEDRVAYRFNGILQDVTVQTGSRRRIEESESRFRTLIEEAPVATCLFVGKELKIEIANQRIIDIMGKGPSVLGKPLAEAIPELIGQPFLHELEKVFETGMDYENRNARADLLVNGEMKVFYVDYIFKPLKDANDKVYAILDMTIDVTSNVLARMELQKSEEKYRLLSDELEKLVSERTKELQRSNEDLQQFAHVASHDLKEPVRKIKTYLDRLATEYTESLPPRGKEFVHKIESATARIYNMIDGVLLYSSVDTQQSNIKKVSLNQIITDVLTDTEITIEQKGAQIQYGSLPDLQGNPVLLYQLFYNLITNALKFSNAEVAPVIKISAEAMDSNEVEREGLLTSQQYVRVKIEDNGIGFEQSYAKEIFKTFKRLNSKDKFEGTGLGLALCKKIVERHGGTISAISAPGKGATFSIILPCSAN